MLAGSFALRTPPQCTASTSRAGTRHSTRSSRERRRERCRRQRAHSGLLDCTFDREANAVWSSSTRLLPQESRDSLRTGESFASPRGTLGHGSRGTASLVGGRPRHPGPRVSSPGRPGTPRRELPWTTWSPQTRQQPRRWVDRPATELGVDRLYLVNLFREIRVRFLVRKKTRGQPNVAKGDAQLLLQIVR